jgi:hypothetical protein
MAALAVDLQLALALEQEVDLLCLRVVMPLRRAAGPESRFGKALEGGVVELADRLTVLGR